MAKPRVFISSTYYDLKHIRSSLDIFIESLGFEPILSEKGDIAYHPDLPLDESCYREVENADIFVLLVGGRYGSEASGDQKKPGKSFYERYESITKKEFESAVEKDTPTYILVETNVYAEYQTFQKNRENKTVSYAHVDSANIFSLLEEILSKPKNNPIHTFERFSDIEGWLRDQWAGLFRDLLDRRSQQQQLTTLSSQVNDLKEVNNTLKKYLEAVMLKITPETSPELIKSEKKRLEEIEKRERIERNRFARHIARRHKLDIADIVTALEKATSAADFTKRIGKLSKSSETEEYVRELLSGGDVPFADLNEARTALGLKSFVADGSDDQELENAPK